MLRAGDLALNRHGVYRLAGDDTVAGKVVRADRTLILQCADGKRLPVAGGVPVRPGDRAAGIVQGREVRIATVVQPAPETVVGLLYVRPRAAYVDSLDPHLKGRIDLVSPTSARTGTVVEVDILAVTGTDIQGRVVRVIEAGNEAARAAEALLAAHRIPREWRADPSRLNLPQAVGQDDITGRHDLRDLPLVTIDGADARDFDDAVFAEPKPRGGWRLVVAIADVSHYVKARSGLDRDARERGNSVYLPDRVVPMLPEPLSNGICSLVPNEDRLALVCDVQVSAHGRVSSYAFYDAVIYSHARLTYDAVQDFLHQGTLDAPPNVVESVNALHDVYRALRMQRDERGALDFDAHETTAPTRWRPTRGRRGGEAQRCSPADRRSDDCRQRRRRTPSRGRAPRSPPNGHPLCIASTSRPPQDKLDVLAMALGIVGERLPKGTVTPSALGSRGRAGPCEVKLARVGLGTLSYSGRWPKRATNRPGSGISAWRFPPTFTSRRRSAATPTSWWHRAIKGEVTPPDELHAAAGHISMTERRAEDVERAVDAWLKCALLEDRIGEAFNGIVAGVTPFGLFVELEGLYIQGLVHVSKLGRDYYEYKPETMSLVAERSGARFSLAERIEVVLEDVSVTTGRIDLRLAGRPAGGRRRRR